jgi:uncharacterized protein
VIRTSSYTIYVDLPDADGQMLLVHGFTGAYDRVSRRVAGFLRSREARRAPKPLYGEWSEPSVEEMEGADPHPETLQLLEQRGYLTRLSVEDEEELFGRLSERLHERAVRQPPSYVFMPTYDCNLRCSYCFQDHMRTDSNFAHLLRSLRPAMVDRIFQAIPEIEGVHGVKPDAAPKRSFGLFGGEPLLARHRDIVAYLLKKAAEIGEADWWAVTNATELEAYEDLLGPGGIARLQITLDGPSEEHDRRRIAADGSGTFERIAANIDRALGRGAVIQVRLNIDRNNLHELPALARQLVERGWPEKRGFSVYTAPINPSNEQTDQKTTLSSWELDRALTELRREHEEMGVIGRPDEGIRDRSRAIFEGREELLPRLKPSFCGAHTQMYIFDPFGDVYACWEKTGDPGIRIARVTPEGEMEYAYEQTRHWRSRSVASNPVCRRCRYALHCGGGCAVLALGQRGRFHANYCDGFASRFRASVAEAYQAYLSGEAPTLHQERVCDL